MTDLSRERYRRDRPPVVTPYPTTGPPAFVGKVVTAASSGQYMTVTPYAVAGTESQGSAGVYTSAGSNVLVYNAGPATPTAGEYYVCRWSAYRWVTSRRSTATIAGYCSVPRTMTLTITFSPVEWNYNGVNFGTPGIPASPPDDDPNGTLTYQTRPAAIPTTVEEPVFVSAGVYNWRNRTLPANGFYGARLAYNGTFWPAGTEGWHTSVSNGTSIPGLGMVFHAPGDPHPWQYWMTAGVGQFFTCNPWKQGVQGFGTGQNWQLTGTHASDDLTASEWLATTPGF